MSFNFNSVEKVSTGKSLKPYTITTVNLKEVNTDFESQYPYMELVFESEEGTFKHREFLPQDNKQSEERHHYGNNSYAPSPKEKFMCFCKILLEEIYPEAVEKINELANAGKITSLKKFVEIVSKSLMTKTDVKFELKLVHRVSKDGGVFASLPNFCYIYENKCYPKPFIGKNLSFTPKEIENKNKYSNGEFSSNLPKSEFTTNQKDVTDDLSNFTDTKSPAEEVDDLPF